MSNQTKPATSPVLFVAIDQASAAGIAKTAIDMITDPYAVIVLANAEGVGAVVLHTAGVDRAELERAYAAARPTIGAAISAGLAQTN
jgi:hypothetical protein